jgi:signal transduction histidine kinase
MTYSSEEYDKDTDWRLNVSTVGLGIASLLLCFRLIIEITLDGINNPSLIASVILLLAVFGLYDYTKRTKKFIGPIFSILSFALLTTAYRSEMTGGLSSPHIPWLPIIPIFAFYILPRKLSYCIVALSFLSLASIGFELLGQFINTNYPPPSFLTRIITLSVIIIASSVITFVYENKWEDMVKNLADERMKLANVSKLADIGEMTSSVAHEINNPLTVVMGRASNLSKMLKMESPDLEKMKKEVEQVQKMSARIARIVRSMKAMSNDYKRMDHSYQTFAQLFEDIMILTENKMKLANIDFKFKNEIENLEQELFPMQLGQVFLNVITNACDAIEELDDKWIEVKIQNYADNKILITFIDSGSGIPIDKRNLLFTPFYSSKDIGKGTGLGLSVSKGIIESFGGVFRLNNNHDNTCFEVVLPSKFEIVKAA